MYVFRVINLQPRRVCKSFGAQFAEISFTNNGILLDHGSSWSGMGSFMSGKLTFLDECTITLDTWVWAFSSVSTFMTLEISLRGKCFWTEFTAIWTFSGVSTDMYLKTAGIGKTLLTESADMFAFALLVHLFYMKFQVVFQGESFWAEWTTEDFIAMSFFVSVQRWWTA